MTNQDATSNYLDAVKQYKGGTMTADQVLQVANIMRASFGMQPVASIEDLPELRGQMPAQQPAVQVISPPQYSPQPTTQTIIIQEKKGMGCFAKGLIGVAGLIVFACIIILIGAANMKTPALTTTISTAAPQSVASKATNAPAATVARKAKVGETIEQGDYKLTIASVEFADTVGSLGKAKSGNVLVSVDVIIESKAATGVSVNPFYASVKDGDAYKYDPYVFGKDPSLSSQNDLPSGEKMRGWLTFEVPTTAKGLVFQYSPMSFINTVMLSVDLGR